MSRTFIVTGGAGFIGSHIARQLIDRGDKVIVLDNLSTGCIENIPSGADFIKIDLGDAEAYREIEGITCDAVFHLAGQSSGEASFSNPYYDFRSHAVSTFCMLDWCKRKSVRRFLYASSMSVYGDPQTLPVTEECQLQPKTFYAAGKAAAESYVRLYQTLGVDTTLFRMFSVYGPGQNLDNMMQGMVSIYLSFMLKGEPVLVKGARERFRDFVFVGDVAEAWIGALDNPRAFGKTYNLGGGKATTVEELITLMKKVYGDNNYPVLFADSTPGDQFGMYADIRNISADLGWQPCVTLENGLKLMLETANRRMSHDC